MLETPKIIDLEKVIEPHLHGSQLVSYQTRYLTRPGENYGSVMLAVTANVKQINGVIEERQLVAKLPPITNDLYWQIFQPQRTCLTENAIYKFVAPAIRELQLEHGIPEGELFDDFSEYYGSRISLDATATKVDRDAVLVLENLQTSGFRPGNRHKMFDGAHTKLVIEQMAKYHALPIALRLKKPAYYNENVRPYFRRFNINDGIEPESKKQMDTEIFRDIKMATNNNESIVERIEELFALYNKFWKRDDCDDGLFTTLMHGDMWINNLMLQYDENGKPSKLKFVDYQIAQYESLAHDIIFFFLSSVETSILKTHYHEFLEIYYKSFIDCLESVGVVIAAYTYELFLAEIKRAATIEIPHALIMTKIILADSSNMPEDFKDVDMQILTKNTGNEKILQKTADIIQLAQRFSFV